MKRPIWVVVILSCAIGIASLCGCRRSKVTADNYNKIKQGMTLTEVQAIFGYKGRQTGTKVTMPNGAEIDFGPIGGLVYSWEEGERSVSVVLYSHPTDGPEPRVRTASYKGL